MFGLLGFVSSESLEPLLAILASPGSSQLENKANPEHSKRE